MEAGSPLLLHTVYGMVEMRALATAELVGDWELEVQPRRPVVHVARGRLELPGGESAWETGAELVRAAGAHRLRPAVTEVLAADPGQRRAHARAELSMLFCAELLTDGDRGRDAAALRQVRGRTTNISAGGAAVEFTIRVALTRDDRLLIELQVPGGLLVTALASVIAAEPGRARLRFDGLESADAVRLDDMVDSAVRRKVSLRRL